MATKISYNNVEERLKKNLEKLSKMTEEERKAYIKKLRRERLSAPLKIIPNNKESLWAIYEASHLYWMNMK